MSDRTELDDDVKRTIVHALACWDTPSEVARLVKDEHGLDVSRQAVQAYDPTKRAGAGLSAEFRALFDTTRAAFLQEAASVGIAHRAVRLRRLGRLADRAESMGNIALAADLLMQAAKEVGDSFTNRVALKHSGAVQMDTRPDFSCLSPVERDHLRTLLLTAEMRNAKVEGSDDEVDEA